jgi:Bardet-Biedl syndrome 9 protein
MDGRLEFFEQDQHAFTQEVPNCLVPGPICYVDKLDAFITANSQMEVVCYKYQMLGSASQGKNRSQSSSGK